MTDLDTLAKLMCDLDAVGVRKMIPEGDNLRLIPTVAIPPALLAQVKAHKADLLAALRPMFGLAPVAPPTSDLPEIVPFDALPLPGPPCAVCGSLEQWQDLLGRKRCGVCDADVLHKSLQLVNRATRLRQQAQSRKPAPHEPRCCIPGGQVDILDVDGHRPLQRQPEGFAGV
jgi:hypothetical protein